MKATSTTIRISVDTKKLLEDKAKAFKVFHGFQPTLDQLIRTLVHDGANQPSPPANTEANQPSPPANADTINKKASKPKKPLILELYKQGLDPSLIASSVGSTRRYCLEVIKKHGSAKEA